MASRTIIDNASGSLAYNGGQLTLPAPTEQGQVLVGNTSGVWAAASPAGTFKNRIINGDMRINQRYGDTPVQPDTNTYVNDRWVASNGIVNYSVYFDGNGDYLSISQNSALSFDTGDFTIECWIYPTATTGQDRCIWETRAPLGGSPVGGMVMFINSSGNLSTFTSGGIRVTSTSAVTVNAWQHIALVRSAGTMAFYINGVQSGTSFYNGSIICASTLRIGARDDLGFVYSGYISNLRATKGVALYTTNFTPSTSPLPALASTSLLTCASSTFIDKSSNNFSISRSGDAVVSTANPFPNPHRVGRIAGWSNYFDGNGDYLSIADNAALDMGASDFTIECWYYPVTTVATDIALFSKRATATWAGVLITFDSNMFPRMFATTNGTSWGIQATSSTACSVGVWNHIAMTRSGNTWSLWVNGSLGSNGTLSGTVPDNAASFMVGAGANDATRIINQCYISNFRVIKGTALYTTNFTPSTMPLIPVTSTSLLTCASETLQDKSSNNFTITKNGDVSVSTLSPFSANFPAGFNSALGWSVLTPVSASTSDPVNIRQRIEGLNVADLQWGTSAAKSITLSFWVRSSITGTYCIDFRNEGSTRSYVAEYSVTSANTWERKTVTIPGDTAGIWTMTANAGLRFDFDLGSGSVYSATAGSWQSGVYTRSPNQINFIGSAIPAGARSNDFMVTGVQLELGSVATPFETRPMQTELALCQRYYQRMGASGTILGSGTCINSTNAIFYLKYFQAMRATPTVSTSLAAENGTLIMITGGATWWVQTTGAVYYGDNTLALTFGRSSAALPSGGAAILYLVSTGGTPFIALSSEL